MDSSIASALRSLPGYVYLADLFRGKRVLELGCGDGAGAAFLARNGAAQVVGVDRSPEVIEAARGRHRAPALRFVASDYGKLELEDRGFDVVCVTAGVELVRKLGVLEEARRVLVAGGQLVVIAPSADRPDARGGGVAYHELVGRLEPLFGATRMVGVTPFVGFALVEYGEAEVEDLELDAQLASLGGGRDAVTEYVAVAGMPGPARGYLVVEVPTAEGLDVLAPPRPAGAAAAAPPVPERRVRRDDEVAALEKKLAQLEAEAARASARAALELDEAKRRGVDADAMARAAEQHRAEMGKKIAELRERDELIEELQHELEDLHAAERAAVAAARESAARSSDLEGELKGLRTKLAKAEAEVLRLGQQPKVDPGKLAELEKALAEKTTEAEKGKQRWKDAEGKTDELWRKIGDLQKELVATREGGVENARMQRQAAQIALTRAVDEASKKMVSVQDQLIRTERERKELEAGGIALRARVAELEAAAAAADGLRAQLAAASAAAAAADALRARVAELEGAEAALRAKVKELDDAGSAREASARAELAAVQVQLAGVKGELGMAKAEVAERVVEVAEKAVEAGRLRAEVEEARAELAAARTAIRLVEAPQPVVEELAVEERPPTASPRAVTLLEVPRDFAETSPVAPEPAPPLAVAPEPAPPLAVAPEPAPEPAPPLAVAPEPAPPMAVVPDEVPPEGGS